MGYIGYSPWTDAAAYGEGLGRTLSQAMLQMPVQRQQLAMQNAQFDQQKQQEALRIALEQKAQDASQHLGLAQLNLHQQELAHNQQAHEAQMALERAKIAAMHRGEWRISETKGGVPVLLNQQTGEAKPLDLGGLGANPVHSMTPNQQQVAFGTMQRIANGMVSDGSYTNATLAPFFQGVTNNIARLNNAINPPQPYQGGLGQTGVPWSQGVDAVNSPIAQGLGAMPVTNAVPRIKRWNQTTGQLE